VGRYWSGGRTWTGGRLWADDNRVDGQMAITNYAELKAAVAAWLARSDLSDKIEDFISLNEAWFNRKLRTRYQEEVTSVFSINGERVALPDGFRSVRSFFYPSGGNRYYLAYRSPQQLKELYPTDTADFPRHYTILGDEFIFGPVPNATYTATLWYYKSFTALSSGNPTNDALTKNPDLYLFGSLVQAESYLQNDQRMVFWKQHLAEIVSDISEEDKRDRVGGSSLTPQAGYGEKGYGRW
jgi:hypothetical protein